jgi:hypothetical protein
MRSNRALFVGSFAIIIATLFAARFAISVPTATPSRVFEIRTYTTNPGKLPDLLKRFREHTTAIFEKHGMANVGYWVPTDEPRSGNTLIYILAHPNRETAKKNWAEFRSDPQWQKVQRASEAGGKILAKVESVFADPTDFSAIK